jgi:hypothetical protein
MEVNMNQKFPRYVWGGTGSALGTTAGVLGGVNTVGAIGGGGLSGPGIMAGLSTIGGTVVGGMAVVAVGTAVLAVGGLYAGYRVAKLQKEARS